MHIIILYIHYVGIILLVEHYMQCMKKTAGRKNWRIDFQPWGKWIPTVVLWLVCFGNALAYICSMDIIVFSSSVTMPTCLTCRHWLQVNLLFILELFSNKLSSLLFKTFTSVWTFGFQDVPKSKVWWEISSPCVCQDASGIIGPEWLMHIIFIFLFNVG